MKVVLWMAISANGYIARENNKEDFISHDSWIAWLSAVKQAGCFVWGRKTYEIVGAWPVDYFKDLNGIEAIVITANRNYQIKKGFSIAGSPEEAIKILESKGYNTVILTGGSTVNASFAKFGLIDEAILNIEPVIIGRGIPLFAPNLIDLKLQLTEMRSSEGKTIQLAYQVIK